MATDTFPKSHQPRIATEVLQAVGIERKSISNLPRNLVSYIIRLAMGSKAVQHRRDQRSDKRMTKRTLQAVQDLRAHRNAIAAALKAAEGEGQGPLDVPKQYPGQRFQRRRSKE